MDVKSLANSINDIFVDLTNDFEPLTPSGPPPYFPEDLLVTQHEVYHALSSINMSKAVGPDNIPNKLLKDFAFELAPVIQDIYNQSLKDGNIPLPLKSSIVNPIPSGAGATGVAGATAPLPKQCGGSTGATGCPFYRNCTSKFVRYSQELEFITIFKQCISNLCLIFNQLWQN